MIYFSHLSKRKKIDEDYIHLEQQKDDLTTFFELIKEDPLIIDDIEMRKEYSQMLDTFVLKIDNLEIRLCYLKNMINLILF